MTDSATLEQRTRFTEEDFKLVREKSIKYGLQEIGERVAKLMWMTDTAPIELREALREAIRTENPEKLHEAYGKTDEHWNQTAEEAYEVVQLFFDKIKSLNGEKEQSEAKAKSAKEAREEAEKRANRLNGLGWHGALYGALVTALLGVGAYTFTLRGTETTEATLDIPKYVDTKEKDGIRRTFKADAIGSSEDSSVLIRNEAFTTVNNAVARAEYNDRHSNRLRGRHQYTAKELRRLHQTIDNLTTESPGAITPQEAYQASLKIGETGGLSQLGGGK